MSEHISTTTKPEVIHQLATTVYSSFAMLAGIQLDVFTYLKNGPLTGSQIADAMGVDPARLERLLHCLAASHLLTINGDRFANTDEANRFLIPGSPSYLGDHPHTNPLLNFYNWSAALKTAESIRTGIPQDMFDFSSLSEDDLESMFRSTRPVAHVAGQMLAEHYDFNLCRSFLDVGGGSGALAIAVKEAYPRLQVSVMDLPTVAPVTRRLVAEAGAADKVEVVEADVVGDKLRGSYDSVALRALIQVLPPDQAGRALKNLSQVIRPGGEIYILGHILDDSRISPLHEVGMNMVFLNEYDEGACYTEKEHRDWLAEAGFDQIQKEVLPNLDGIIRARRSTQG